MTGLEMGMGMWMGTAMHVAELSLAVTGAQRLSLTW